MDGALLEGLLEGEKEEVKKKVKNLVKKYPALEARDVGLLIIEANKKDGKLETLASLLSELKKRN